MPRKNTRFPKSRPRLVDRGAEHTLWTLHQDSRCARCALKHRVEDWELRMLIDDVTLLVEVCGSPEEVQQLAHEWRWRLRRRGWWEPRIAAELH